MDGSDEIVQQFISYSDKVTSTTKMAFDLTTETLYWLTQQEETIYSASVNNKTEHPIRIEKSSFLKEASDIAIFKVL